MSFADFLIKEFFEAYNRKKLDELTKENEELKREYRRITSIDAEYKVKDEE